MNHQFARELRKNTTDAERHLWRRLRQRQMGGHKFRRQAPIGPYVVDFVCFEQMLVIELDGGQHQEQKGYDSARSDWLSREGFCVLRFWNHEVFQEEEAIVKTICKSLGMDA